MKRVFIEKQNLEDAYVLPIVCTFPFKVDTWPKYILTFGWIYYGFCNMVVMKVISSIVQFTLLFYVIAVIKNIKIKASKFGCLG